jgi:RNA polymerase sigma-70 factor (ECF subfamily)
MGANVSADRVRRGRLESLLHAHQSRLRRLCHGMLTDRTRVDDVMQEAFIKVFRKLPASFESPAHEAAWLYTIVYRCCLDELRRTKRHLPAHDELESRTDPIEQAGARLGITRALRELSPEERAAVLLVDVVGFDYRTAAATVGVPEGTIASRLSSARSRLHRLLDDEETGR